MALGLLTGKYTKSGPFPKGIRGGLFRQILPEIQPLLNTLQEVAQVRQKTIAQVALNWCIGKGTIPIPGAKSVEQARQNLGAIVWQLNNSEITELDHVAANSRKKMVQNIFQTK